MLLHGETPAGFQIKPTGLYRFFLAMRDRQPHLKEMMNIRAIEWHFLLHTDGNGFKDMIIEGGGFRNRFCKDQEKTM